MTAPRLEAELVLWLDSASHGDGWHDLKDVSETVKAQGLLPVQSVGFVIHETDDSVTLALSWSPDDEGNPCRVQAPLTIPKFAITSRRRLFVHEREPETAGGAGV